MEIKSKVDISDVFGVIDINKRIKDITDNLFNIDKFNISQIMQDLESLKNQKEI